MAVSGLHRPLGIWVAAVIAVVFGLLTIKSGGSVLFIDGIARKEAGNYVPLVLWFNFLMGFFYLVAGAGLFLRKKWAMWLSVAIVVSTAAVFAVFGFHILNDGAHETRTIAAMTIRTIVWASIAAYAFLIFRNKA